VTGWLVPAGGPAGAPFTTSVTPPGLPSFMLTGWCTTQCRCAPAGTMPLKIVRPLRVVRSTQQSSVATSRIVTMWGAGRDADGLGAGDGTVACVLPLDRTACGAPEDDTRW